jgi:AcrR family transcriptional regulator
MKAAERAGVTRVYRMRARAEAAERRVERVLDAAIELWRERWYDEITLEDLVERSGVSASTILRRFGSKEGVLAAVIAADPLGVVTGRDRIAAGDVEGAVLELVEHYERVGDAVIRDLALEDRIPAIGQAVKSGRALHRAFCARVFSPWLPTRRGPAYDRRLAQFIVATDVYTWKLFRRDHGLSKDQMARAMRELLDRLMKEE